VRGSSTSVIVAIGQVEHKLAAYTWNVVHR
jgi:hypothetical protein